MKAWIILFPFLFSGCHHVNIIDESICDNAFTLSIPKDIRHFKENVTAFGDDILCAQHFSNIDSTFTIRISLYSDTSQRPLKKFTNGQIDKLRHLYGDIVILKKEEINQYGIDMLSILIELPLIEHIPGSIVAQKVFYTHKGKADVEIKTLFRREEDKEVALNLVNLVGTSISPTNAKIRE